MSTSKEQMINFIREHDLCRFVAELNTEGTKEGADAAIEYVYDQHTLSCDEFKNKYFK